MNGEKKRPETFSFWYMTKKNVSQYSRDGIAWQQKMCKKTHGNWISWTFSFARVAFPSQWMIWWLKRRKLLQTVSRTAFYTGILKKTGIPFDSYPCWEYQLHFSSIFLLTALIRTTLWVFHPFYFQPKSKWT